MINPRVLACLMLLLLAAPRSAGPEAMPPTEIYVWQRVWIPQLAAALLSTADFVTRWHILIAQGGAEGASQAQFRRFAPDWAAVARSLRPATLVIRIDGQIDPATSSHMANQVAALFLTTPAPSHERIEIDHDCATQHLQNYAGFLAALRAVLPPRTGIDITALPAWLPSPTLPKLIAAADRIILQLHGVDDPKTSLFLPERAEAWVALLDRISTRPFLISLPAYSARIIRATNNALLAAEAEQIDPDPRPGSEIIVPPASVAGFLAHLRAANPPLLAGIVWFRLPLPGDLRAWSSETLRNVAQGRTPSDHITLTLSPRDATAAQEISLTNEGDDAALPDRIALAPGCTGDAFGNYASSGTFFLRIRNNLLRYHQHLRIGWQRCTAREPKTPEASSK